MNNELKNILCWSIVLVAVLVNWFVACKTNKILNDFMEKQVSINNEQFAMNDAFLYAINNPETLKVEN